MKIKTKFKNPLSTWFTSNLKKEVREVFEPRYNRKLSDIEVIEIANNLTSFVEIYAKSKYGRSTK